MEIDRPITIAIIFLIVLILIFYVVMPKYRSFQNLLAVLGMKETELQAKNAYFVEVTEVYKELMQYQDVLQKIECALPSKFSPAELVNFVYKKTIENGVSLKGIGIIRSSEVGTGTNVKEIILPLELTGSYSSLKNFLSSLEKSARLVEIEDISFAVQPPSLEKPQVSTSYPFSVTIKLYSY